MLAGLCLYGNQKKNQMLEPMAQKVSKRSRSNYVFMRQMRVRVEKEKANTIMMMMMTMILVLARRKVVLVKGLHLQRWQGHEEDASHQHCCQSYTQVKASSLTPLTRRAGCFAEHWTLLILAVAENLYEVEVIPNCQNRVANFVEFSRNISLSSGSVQNRMYVFRTWFLQVNMLVFNCALPNVWEYYSEVCYDGESNYAFKSLYWFCI